MVRTTRRGFLKVAGGMMATGVVAGLAVRGRRASYFGWKEIGDGVHATTDASTGGNVMVVVGEGESLVVDAKFGPLSPVLRREADSLGAPVRHLLNTHHHADHTSGNVGFRDGVQVHAHEKALPRITSQVERYCEDLARGADFLARAAHEPEAWMLEAADRLAAARETFKADAWAPDHTLAGRESTIAFGNRAVEVRHVGPGHTDNDVFVKPAHANIMHAGDLLFNGMHPYFDPAGGGSSEGWIRSLEGVIALCDADTVVVPGHGPIGDVASLHRGKAYIEQLREAVARAIEAGAMREEAIAMRWDFMEGLDRAQLSERAIAFVYDEMR